MRLNFKRAALACLCMAMSACQPKVDGSASAAPAPAPAAPFDNPDACGASKLAAWVGKSDNASSRAAIAKSSGASAIRWLTPGMAVTMDYSPTRLNANIGGDGRYTGFNCA